MKFSALSVSRWVLPCIFALMLLAASCSKRPGNIIGEDKMVKLMVDMEIAEAYASQNSLSSEDRLKLGQRVMATHGVSKEQLDSTLAWYGKNLDNYTALFEKVDKEINRRRIKYSDNPNEANITLANLWPYSPHLVVSPLSGSDAMVFSLHNPKIEKGEIVNFSFVAANRTSGKGVIGVEYADGSGETVVDNFSSKSKVEISLQSDTAKTISRLYGYTLFKDLRSKPLFIDSITITLQPIDSTDYNQKKRNQRSFGAFYRRKPPVKEEKRDSVAADSISVDSTALNQPSAKTGDSIPKPKPATFKEPPRPVAASPGNHPLPKPVQNVKTIPQ